MQVTELMDGIGDLQSTQGWNASYYGLGSSLPLSLWMWLGNRRVMRNIQMEMNKKNRYMFHWDWKKRLWCLPLPPHNGMVRPDINISIRSDWLLVVYLSFLLEFHTGFGLSKLCLGSALTGRTDPIERSVVADHLAGYEHFLPSA